MKKVTDFKLVFFIILSSIVQDLNSQMNLEVKFQPGEKLYVYENRGVGTPVNLYTAVIQNIAFVNHSKDSIIIDEVIIEAKKGGRIVQQVYVEEGTLRQSAKKFKAYEAQGVLQFYDFQFQTSKYLKDIALAESLTLPKNHAIIISHRTLLFQSLPDSILVRAKAHSKNHKELLAQGGLQVINRVSQNQYSFPLRGMWSALGAPSLVSHHRWGSIQEFAFDFVKLGADGLTHEGDGSELKQYFSYGAAVYAIGDGKVVTAYSEAAESNSNLKQPNESTENYMERTAAEQQKLLSKGFSYAMGNHIILEHENGEYSHYLHLKRNTIKVKAGDIVKRGQHIASLGHSGNSTEPHLHFHVTDGPDMAYSRSLPVTFDNISLYPDDDGNIQHLHYGQNIITKD